MYKIIRTSEYPIKIETFGINQDDIEKVKKEKTIEEENRIIIGLIIGKIRKKLDELAENNSDQIIQITIDKVIKLLETPIHIIDKQKESIITIEDLRSFINDGLKFKDIEGRFLNNEIEIEKFLYSTEIFLNSSLKEII